MEKVILTTGGTGGHIFPALSVAEELRNRYPDIQLLFMGSLYGPEKALAEKWNIPFEGFDVRGFLGRGFKAIPAAFKMLNACIGAYKKIKKFNPDLLAGFGGYASFAPVLGAWFGKKPILIHEQNAIPGSGNKIMAHLAKRVCVSLPDTKGMGSNVIVTGNPARKIFNMIYPKKFIGKNLFVLGGSQGSHALNKFIQKNLSHFMKAGINIIHQTGVKDLLEIREAYKAHNFDPNNVYDFIDNMADIYEWADLVICRAGASTIAELCICGLPAVFVPFPAAIHDHQTKNALALTQVGAAELIPEDKLNDFNSVSKIIELLSDKKRLIKMSEASHKLARENSAKLLVDSMEKMLINERL